MYAPSDVKLFDLVEVEDEDEDEEEPLDREEPDEDEDPADREEPDEDEEEAEEEDFEDVDEPSSREPQVSVVLSSTSWAERDTDGLREDSPGSSTAVSS